MNKNLDDLNMRCKEIIESGKAFSSTFIFPSYEYFDGIE
jgi:hypothetical protein